MAEILTLEEIAKQLASIEAGLTRLSRAYREQGLTILVNTHGGVLEWDSPKYPPFGPKLRVVTLEENAKRWKR